MTLAWSALSEVIFRSRGLQTCTVSVLHIELMCSSSPPPSTCSVRPTGVADDNCNTKLRCSYILYVFSFIYLLLWFNISRKLICVHNWDLVCVHGKNNLRCFDNEHLHILKSTNLLLTLSISFSNSRPSH